VREGAAELSVILMVIAVAVLREGSETVLFLHGIGASPENSAVPMAVGGLVGLAGGIAVGWLLFAGLLRIPLKWFFTATAALVLVLAAGMAAQTARFLIQADVVPSLGSPVWDTSWLVDNGSVAGKVLQGLMGYDARPAGMQDLEISVQHGKWGAQFVHGGGKCHCAAPDLIPQTLADGTQLLWTELFKLALHVLGDRDRSDAHWLLCSGCA